MTDELLAKNLNNFFVEVLPSEDVRELVHYIDLTCVK